MPHKDDPLLGAEIIDTGVPLQVEEPTRPMEDPERVVSGMIEEALQWREENLDPELEKATEYYKGEPFGDEEAGRSQVVDTTVRDVVQAVLPSLLRIFFGPDKVVEFQPDSPDTVPVADQMTEGVNYVVREDNKGFVTFYSMLKDALIRKLGIVKYWWEDKIEVLGSEHTGLTADQIAFLSMQPGLELEVLGGPEGGDEEEAEDPDLMEAQSEIFDVEIRRVENRGKVRIEAIPPEELIFSPQARDKQDARMIGHVREARADELVAMGVSRSQVREHIGRMHRTPGDNEVERARRIDEGEFETDEQFEATREVPFAEVYVRMDEDDDGISELHRIWCIGDNWEWAVDEEGEAFNTVVDEVPLAIFCPDIEPHTVVGHSIADYVMDLQRVRSVLTRGMLDSLYQHIRPSTEVVEGEVNIADLKNPEVGRFVRVKRPGMMREVPTEFVGGDVLPVLGYTDEMKENRTGISKAAAGLDADALQSSTKAAVAATLSASQQRIEMIARIFAETGMTDLFRGIARLMVKHQDHARQVRVGGEFVEIDPRHWNLDLDVTANVGLGVGMTEERFQILTAIAEKQEQMLEAGAPIVGFREYRNTLARMTELAGFENDAEFWKPFGPQEAQQFAQQQAQQAQEPTTEEQLVQIEAAKIQQSQQETMAEMQLEAAKLALEREKVARELALDEAELDLKGQKEATDAAIEQARTQIEAATKGVDALKKMSETRVGDGG